MTYVLSVSRLMTAAEVIKTGKEIRQNAAIIASLEATLKQQSVVFAEFRKGRCRIWNLPKKLG